MFLFSSSTPECNLDDWGRAIHWGVGTHVAPPTPIPLVYNTASLIGVEVPVRRDVLMMCVSTGRTEGEIAWRRCGGIGSRGHVVGWLERRSLDTLDSVKGQKEKRGVLSVDVVGLSSCE